MIRQRIVLGLIIGLVSYSSLYLGKGIQKYAVEGIKSARTLKTKHSGIWIVGTILTALPVFLQWAALLFAPINIIAPLEGIGLVILLIFASRRLEESLGITEIAAAGLIAAGIFCTAFFYTPPETAGAASVSSNRILYIFVPLAIVEAALIIFALKSRFTISGYIIGFGAGTAMAFQTLSKRISAFPGFAVYGIIGVAVFAPLTLFITQLGFAKARANRVVPAFTAASIVIAGLAGALVLDENIGRLQLIGITLVVIGAVAMTAGGLLQREKSGPEEADEK